MSSALVVHSPIGFFTTTYHGSVGGPSTALANVGENYVDGGGPPGLSYVSGSSDEEEEDELDDDNSFDFD